jgi:hypothetical protein
MYVLLVYMSYSRTYAIWHLSLQTSCDIQHKYIVPKYFKIILKLAALSIALARLDTIFPVVRETTRIKTDNFRMKSGICKTSIGSFRIRPLWSWSDGSWIYNCLCNQAPPWSYDSWIYNYILNQCISPLMLWVLIPLMAGCTIYNIGK